MGDLISHKRILIAAVIILFLGFYLLENVDKVLQGEEHAILLQLLLVLHGLIKKSLMLSDSNHDLREVLLTNKAFLLVKFRPCGFNRIHYRVVELLIDGGVIFFLLSFVSFVSLLLLLNAFFDSLRLLLILERSLIWLTIFGFGV